MGFTLALRRWDGPIPADNYEVQYPEGKFALYEIAQKKTTKSSCDHAQMISSGLDAWETS